MNIRPAGLTKSELFAGLGIKILLGLIYGYLFLHYYHGDDTWKFHHASLLQTKLLLNDPAAFFRNEFTPLLAMKIGNGWAGILQLYFEELQYALLVKPLAVMNLISHGNYYINAVLFNFIVFFGHYWLFRLMTKLFPEKRKLFFIAIFFFLPVVFWLSGIRIDGLLFFFLSLLLLNLCGSQHYTTGKIAAIIIGLAGVTLSRPQIVPFVLIGMIAYLITKKTKRNAWVVFSMVNAVALLFFFLSIWILPGKGLPAMVVNKQHQFLQLKGTTLQLDSLETTATSFAKVLPQAVGNTFFRPFPWEAKGFLQLIASAEVITFWIIVLMAVWQRHEQWKVRISHPVIVFMLSQSVSIYIFIGYIVPFPGAIVRYKTIPELLILCCMIAISKWGSKINYRNI